MVRDDTISCCTLVGIRAIAIFIEAEWSSDNTVACIQVRYCFNNIQATKSSTGNTFLVEKNRTLLIDILV